jgi:hypothetical protein
VTLHPPASPLYRAHHKRWLEHCMVIVHAHREVAESRGKKVSPVIASLLPFVPLSAINLDDYAILDKHIHAADLRNAHLRPTAQSSPLHIEAHERLDA